MAKKNVSAEDSELFRQAIGPIKRLTDDKIHHQQKAAPKKKLQPRPLSSGRWKRGLATEPEPVSHEDSIHFTAPGIQKSVLAKLRKGFFGVDAELDLHGYTSRAAQQSLLQFLDVCTAAGHRCVHIIHGKGHRSEENLPVLKNHINQWLRQHQSVQAFCSTPQRFGGTGAVWVLIKVTN